MKWVRQVKNMEADGTLASITSWANLRRDILIEVLCKLPANEYQELQGRHVWFIAPPVDALGAAVPIPDGHREVVYLSPCLESGGYSRVDIRMIVAHEVAHSLLNHTHGPPGDAVEDEAWRMVVRLQFATAEQVAELRGRLGHKI